MLQGDFETSKAPTNYIYYGPKVVRREPLWALSIYCITTWTVWGLCLLLVQLESEHKIEVIGFRA